MALLAYKCPNCGGGLTFDPASQKFKCEYCLSEFSEGEMEKQEAKKQETGEREEDDRAAALYVCPNCGAEIVTDETTAASFCYYCHNPVVLSGRLSGEFLPDYVLPFAVNKKKATEIFLEWVGKKKFVPRSFYANNQLEKLTGVYFPYLLYSCKVDGEMAAEAESQKTWVTGNIRYTEHKKYQVKRVGQLDVKNVTRNALSKSDRRLVEGVLPFDMEKMLPFSTGYLSGFQAEKRDMEGKKFAPEVEQEVRDYTLQKLKESVEGYNSLQVQDSDLRIKNPKWEYALLPVWVMIYRHKADNTVYYFAMNGQNGKICGKLPIDKGKLAALFAAVFLPLCAVLMAGGWFL